MKMQLWITLGAVGTTLTAAWMAGFLASGPSPKPPHAREEAPHIAGSGITITPRELDLGEVQRLSPGVGSFLIRNESSRTISVRDLISHCACLRASLANRSIEPQTEQEVVVEMTASHIVGRQRRNSLTLIIDGQDDVSVEVSCVASEFILVDPPSIVVTDNRPFAVKLTAADEQSFSVSSEDPWIRTSETANNVQIVTIDPSGSQEALPKNLKLNLTHSRCKTIVIKIEDHRTLD